MAQPITTKFSYQKYKKRLVISGIILTLTYLAYIFYYGWPMDFDCKWNCSVCHGIPLGNNCLGYKVFYPKYSLGYPTDKYSYTSSMIWILLMYLLVFTGLIFLSVKFLGRSRKVLLITLFVIFGILVILIYRGFFVSKTCMGDKWCHGVPLPRGSCFGYTTIKNPTFCPPNMFF